MLHRHIKLSVLTIACAMALQVQAQEDGDELDAGTELVPMTIIASKSERPAAEIAAPVTIITDEEISRTLSENISDIVRYIPGVTVPLQGQRFGLAGFNIRGLGGNRVQVSVDGVRIPDGFAIGDFSNASRNFIDTDSLKQVEILRGPASSLFGSSALAGVVAIATKDPADWLADTTGDLTARLRGGYYTADEGWVASGTVAGRSGRWSGSIQWVERAGSELDNQGSVGGTGDQRTEPNPHDFDGRNILAKLLFDEEEDLRWRLTVEQNETNSETDVLSLARTRDFTQAFGFPFIIDTSSLTGDDRAERQRVSIDLLARDPSWADVVSWQLYYQTGETIQDTFETRTTLRGGPPAVPDTRFRRAFFDQSILGTELTGRWSFETGVVSHDLVAGIEVFETDTEQFRDGQLTNLVTGEVSNILSPDTFPVRDFPNTTTLEAGFYLENRMTVSEKLKLIPGLRIDYFDLDPDADAIFIEDNPGFEPQSVQETSVTPRLGAIYSLTDSTDLFAQYARGFRAPPYNDVNVGFTNLQFGYTAIPNADLKPEESQGWELGLRSRGRWGMLDVSAYHNDYDDFIENLVPLGADPQTGLLVFQSQNLTDVRIRGIEAAATLNLNSWTDRLKDWQLKASVAYADGEDQSRDVALTSIEPLTAVLGLRWLPNWAPVDLEIVATAVGSQDDLDDPDLFRAPGYVTLDLLAGWQINPSLSLRAGLFNLTDRKYWAWSNVRGRLASNPALDRFTQPGFNAGASLTWQL